MEESSKEFAQLWTLKVSGGPRFTAGLEGNPALTHAGGMSVINLMSTRGQVEAIAAEARSLGCAVEVWPMAGQTSEQKEIRDTRLKALDLAEMPCVDCQECAWFDPWEDEVCGFAGLPNASRRQLLLTSEAHRESLLKCPIT